MWPCCSSICTGAWSVWGWSVAGGASGALASVAPQYLQYRAEAAHWPWQRGSFAFLGGLTVTYLNGSITAADENNGQQMTQKISETFPLLSAGVEWRPLPSLRLSLSGDYIRYSGNRADELEARVLWQVLGPVGLEAGYRQRRYKINEPNNRLDAKVAGMRIGLHMAIPL